MKKPGAALVAAAFLPFLAGCVRVHQEPVSDAATRDVSSLRGVVLGEAAGGSRIEFVRVDHVEWTDSAVAFTGVAGAEDGGRPAGVTTRSFPLADVAGVLVRGVDPDRTSIVIAAVGVGAAAVVALLITGENQDSAARPGGP